MEWVGNQGQGTADYKSYKRDHTYQVENKKIIEGSSDPSFRGDPTRYNPEELLVSALSSCHMLWYLHLCSVNNVVVVNYVDHASGTMEEFQNGSGKFNEVILNPEVTVEDESMIPKAMELHHEANKYCFIANSINFPVRHLPKVVALVS